MTQEPAEDRTPVLPGRYEVAIATDVGWVAPREPGENIFTSPARQPETTVIEFDGRRFVWHALRTAHDDKLCWPVISVMIANVNNPDADLIATNRFISALVFVTKQAMSYVTSSTTGFKAELDPPFLGQPGAAPTLLMEAPTEIVVEDDERLRLVIALIREAAAAESPFYRFLAFYNALDAAFDSVAGDRQSFIDAALADVDKPAGHHPTFTWSNYLHDSLRNAVAHTIRNRPGSRSLNPDDFADRRALDEASRHVEVLARRRVGERWPQGVIVR